MIEPLRLSYDVECPRDHAFDVWTTRLSSWWPKGHSASSDPDTVVVFEPRLGGRIFERTSDGTEIDWGEITLWNPPAQLGYRWHITQDASDATDVEISFVAVDGSGRGSRSCTTDGNGSARRARRGERPIPAAGTRSCPPFSPLSLRYNPDTARYRARWHRDEAISRMSARATGGGVGSATELSTRRCR